MRDGGEAEAVVVAGEDVALAFEFIAEMRAVSGTGGLLRLVELAADQAAPAAIAARRHVENEDMRVQLRVEVAARLMMELRGDKARDRLACGAAFAAPCEGVMIFKMLEGGRARRRGARLRF